MSKKSVVIWDGNVRDAALSILLAIDKNQAYSNLLLHETIKRHKIEAKDRALLTEITYGTLQHKMTLDFYLEPFLRSKIDHWVRWLLRLSLYQMHYLTRIPPHAAVNEAVEIAKRRGHKGIASTVNGVLRSILREGVRDTATISDPVERLAIATSHPEWLVTRWVEAYGMERTAAMLEENNVPPMQTVRVNTTKTTVEAAVQSLVAEGLQVEKSELIAECLHIANGQAARTTAFKEGLITIQDESSMLPATVMNPQADWRVLDMCAAPGGKTTHLAEKMQDAGQIIALDLHPHKLDLIDENTARLDLQSISTVPLDGRKVGAYFEANSFDAILVDAPCSGLGVMRRKPDIKYTKREEDLSNLQTIQLALLNAAVAILKPGGQLIYSTCTVDKIENEGTVQAFLAANTNIVSEPLANLPQQLQQKQQDGMLQVFPQDFGSDGFFVAAFRKKEDPVNGGSK